MNEQSPFEYDKVWTPARVDVVRKAVCPHGIPDPDFWLFMLQVQRTGLDPLQKECFCVKRRVNIGNRERQNWVDKYEFQAAAQGMVSRAEQHPDFRGIYWCAVYASETCLVDKFRGSVDHKFNAAKREGALCGAYAIVRRVDRVDIVEWVDFSAVIQKDSHFWGKDPAGMTEKCAIARALRRAYPRTFSGVYIQGEMAPDGEESTTAGDAIETSAHPIPRIQVLPEQTATRLETPTLEVPLTSDAVPVPVPAQTGAAADTAVAMDQELAADSIINEANTVAASAIEAGRTPEALKRARADMAALGAKAKKLPKGSAERERVSRHFADINAQLFGESSK